MHLSIGAGDSDEDPPLSDNDVIPLLIQKERVALRELKKTRAACQVSATIMYMLVLNYVMMPYIGCAGCSQEGGISFSNFHGESGENICLPI